MKKAISLITPFTTLDYANHLSCIVWFSGCNMRCPYCYNAEFVLEDGTIDEEELLVFLKKRQNLLDGVVLSGGECTLYKGIQNLCEKIKKLNFLIKIDTNGSNPKIIQKLIDKDLIDFVALDFKATEEKFHLLTKTNFFDNFKTTLDILNNSTIDFEVRTTIHEDFLNEKDINEMIIFLQKSGYKGVYYLQHYLHVNTLDNLKKPQKSIDRSLIKGDLQIEYRNF